MIFCFGKSRAVFYAGMAATAALSVSMAYRRAGGPLWLLFVTVALAVLVGCAVTVLAANIAAASCESAVQEKLHIALEPEKFVCEYEKAVRAQKPGSAQRIVGSASLADGLCAAGNWKAALEALEEPGAAVPHDKRAALEALVKRNRCRYLLWGEKPKKARAALDDLEKHIRMLKVGNPKLAGNIGADAKLYRTWLALLEGGDADLAELEETMKRTPTKLAKFDVCQMLILASKNARDTGEEARFSRMFAKEGGNLARAKELRKGYQ